MGKWVVIVALAACGERSRAEVRWPDHRRIEEKRISDLEAYNVKLAPQIQQLEERIATLEKQLEAQREAQPVR